MKSFDQLTERSKILLLRKLAEQAMRGYDMPVRRVSFLVHATTYLYRVDTASGEKYVLRIYSGDSSSMAETRTEIFWLNAIQRDTDLRVVQPVKRRDGETITLVSLPGAMPEQCFALFRWVPGSLLGEQATSALYSQFGEMMARLHNHSEKLVLPADIRPKRWDKVFYYPGEKAVYHLPKYGHLFSAERIAMLDEAVRRCDPFLAGLYRAGDQPMLIHGDLHPDNIHVARGKLVFLDFEDICLGLPVQDVAISLYYGRDRNDYNILAVAFQKGYSSFRPWPVESSRQLAGLWAARNTNFINYVAQVVPEPQEMLQGMFDRLKQSLQEMGGDFE